MEDDYYAEVESAPRSSARSGALPLEAGRTLQTVLERGSSTLVTENSSDSTNLPRNHLTQRPAELPLEGAK